MIRTARNLGPNLKRYRSIVAVFARHGFGSFLEYLQIGRRLGLPRRALRSGEVSPLTPAEHLRLALEELGPTFVKLGQVLTTRPDLLPPEFIKELSRLRDAVPPVPWEQVRPVLENEWGQDPGQVLVEIDPVPLAAASLAQVHTAKLADGSEVVVKIQRPEILRTIETDLEILRDLALLAERTSWGEVNRPTDLVEAFSYSLHNELDYRREGRNADRFRRNFAGMETVYIPEIYWEYSTARVLVMERIRGITIDDIAALDAAGVDRKRVAVNAAQIIIKEVLVDGFFHADPHGGNLVVMPGEVIGAMDFGLVGELSDRDRESLVRLYISAVSQDADALVDELVRISAASFQVDRRRLARDLNRLLSSYAGLTLKEVSPVAIADEIIAVSNRHKLVIPASLWLLSKTLVMIEGIGRSLDPEFDIFEVSRPIVEELRLKMLLPNTGWGHAFLRHGADWAEFMRILPRSGRHLLEKVEQNQPFEVDLKESGRIMGGLNRLANRLSLSILIGSLIIGLAFIIPSITAGSPLQILVVVGFIGVVGMGIWLLFSILRGAG